jgi:hypothetical protein
MRHLIILLAFALPAAAQSLYDNTTIHELRMEFYYPAWKDSLVAHVPTETDIPARLTVNGIVLDSIGVRYKGNSSYNVPSEKKPFNLSIDAYREDQLLYGYKTLNLNNFFKDPTCVREKITYDIAAAYFPAVRTAFVKLYINNIYWGLYLNVQQINKIFLREHFSAQGGNLYKGDPPLGGAFGADMSWHGTDTAYYRSRYELKTNEEVNDWSDFITFLNTLNTTSDTAFESVIANDLNVDRALWYLAFCNLLVNLDSYPGSGHNYYLYNNPLDGMNMILWDVNEVLGTFSSEQLTIPQRETLSPLYKSTDAARPLVKRLLAVPSFRRRYYAHFRTMFEEVFSPEYWQPLITQYQNLIAAPLADDTKKLYTMTQFSANVTANTNTSTGNIPGILSLINNRRAYLFTLPEFTAARPSVSLLTHELHTDGPADSVTFIAGVGGASSVFLWHSVNNVRFTSHTMTRGVSDTSRWTATLPLPTGGGRYRFYIEAVSAAGLTSISPAHAEYAAEEFTIPTERRDFPVVINELLASNTKTVKDPQNEYDDWVELYNISADTVRLGGCWMSDEPRPQWRIPPSTVIPPYGYLLVWADDDTLDAGALHANFKLSKSGEAVFLWDSSAAVILDSTAFGAQGDDRSWARKPDGTGDFQAADPTPGTTNGGTVAVNAADGQPTGYVLAQNFPNPFNPATTITYTLPVASRVKLTIVDVLGREIAVLVDGMQPAGRHRKVWNAAVASGLYMCRMDAFPANHAGEPFIELKKMILVR